MQPRGLRGVVLLLCIWSSIGLPFNQTWSAPAVAIILLFLAIGYIIYWALWRGHNWARWVVLVESAIFLLKLLFDNLHGPGQVPLLQRVMVAGDGALGAYLLYWLNSAPVKAYFTRSRPRLNVSPDGHQVLSHNKYRATAFTDTMNKRWASKP